jgi:hypothetical protein
MEQLISQAKKQFDQILSYVQVEAQSQQLNEVEKGIFYALLKLGVLLLAVFFKQKGTGHKGKVHVDKKGITLNIPIIQSKTRNILVKTINIPQFTASPIW